MYRIMRLVGIVCGISVIILNFLVIDHVLAEEVNCADLGLIVPLLLSTPCLPMCCMCASSFI